MTPIIIFGGTIGNILTIIVVLSRHFRHNPLSTPFISLATVDIGVLYFNLLDIWLGAISGDSLQLVRDLSPAGCKFSSFGTIFLTHCSSWILVLINVERVVSVWRPLQARILCTSWRVAVGLVLLMLALAAISVHLFWTLRYNDIDPRCDYNNEILGKTGLTVWLTIDATLFSFLPFIFIFTSNVLICTCLARARRQHRHDRRSRHSDNTKSITTMLVTISIVFLIATTPLTICYQFHDYILDYFKDKPVERALWYELLINTILVLLCYSSNAMNFLLYCVSGSKFRQALREVCKCQKSTYTRRSTYHHGAYALQTNGYQSASPFNTLQNSPSPRQSSLSTRVMTYSNISLQHAIRLENWHEDSAEREVDHS